MITFKRLGTKAYGDIGNQLPQYALLRLVAEKLGYGYGVGVWGGRWWFDELGKDKYPLQKTMATFTDKRGYTPDTHKYLPEIWDIKDGTDLCGFFQSHKYYWGERKTIMRWYILASAYQAKVDAIVGKFPKTGRRVGIQYRLADEYAQTFPILGYMYYKMCLNWIDNELGHAPDTHYIISSDVPRDEIPHEYTPFLPEQVTYVRDDPAVTIFAMTYCDVFIMANSSFSWWTAFLNKASKPVILCPANYLGIDFCYPCEIYPPDWKQIPVSEYRSAGQFYKDWKRR